MKFGGVSSTQGNGGPGGSMAPRAPQAASKRAVFHHGNVRAAEQQTLQAKAPTALPTVRVTPNGTVVSNGRFVTGLFVAAALWGVGVVAALPMGLATKLVGMLSGKRMGAGHGMFLSFVPGFVAFAYISGLPKAR